MKQIAVVGLGRFGFNLAESLAQHRCQVLAIDSDMEKVKKIQDTVTQAVMLDARDEDALKAVGIDEMDTVVVAIGSDIEASMLATMVLKDMGVKNVISKAVNELHGRFLKKIGADRIVSPDMDTGRRLGRSLARPSIVEQIDLGEDYGVFEVQVPPAWVGESISELGIRARYGANIVAIRSVSDEVEQGYTMNVSPLASTVFAVGDILVLLGRAEEIDKLTEK